MNRCLFTYKNLHDGVYSVEGLKLLSPKLKELHLLPYDYESQMQEVQRIAGKISIQGIQPKLSAVLSIKECEFKLVEKNATYIIKPQVRDYKELPQNEDVTMKLAALCGIETPWHGLIKANDDSLLYIIKRFDRFGKNKKRHQEDFAQLIGATRSTKYQADMERVALAIEEFCTFPTLEWRELFKRVVFNFLVGNEDMHLKNYSLSIDEKRRAKLSPAYDFLNTTISMVDAEEEIALEMNGKKKNLLKEDFIGYAADSLFIRQRDAKEIINKILDKIPRMRELIKISFLSEEMKDKYLLLLDARAKRLV
jgi:serine/threonine-protein kinase HipA